MARAAETPDFESLVSLHYAALYRFAMSLTRAESAAADLVQETFLAWAAKGHTLREPHKAKAWLFTTLHRAFQHSQRRVRRFEHVPVEEAETELPLVDPQAMARLDARRVLDLLARLEPEFRSAVALFYLEDYSQQEIAQILEVPVGTVKSRISRGLQQLRAMVADAPDSTREGAV
jgi:RNA polymerase sigma-70 factor (ECF subfamily)